MLRKTLTILSLIGLLLSAGLWGASFVSVAVYRIALPWSLTVWVDNGSLQFHSNKLAQDIIPKLGISNGITWEYGARLRTMSAMGRWHWRLGYMSDNQTFSLMIIPLYLPVLLLGIWPAWLLLPFRRRRRRKKLGLCVNCGYDLRGSKDRCPECGLAIGEKRGPKWVLRKRSIGVCLVISVSAFPIFFIGATSTIFRITDDHALPSIAYDIIIPVSVILAFLATRLVYTLLRWRRYNEVDDEHDS